MKRIICLILSLAMIFSLSVTAFADDSENLAEDNTMLNFCVDVTKKDSYYDAVLWAYLRGLTNGTDNVHFSPDMPVTRGQAVTFFWNLAGKPVVDYFMQMDDVASGSYYTEAVRWALSMGITSGTSKTTFSPDKLCTVGEIITLLWRFSGSPVVNYAMNFKDVSSDAYYAEAIRWALSLGIAHGTTDNTFGPDKICTRAKTVTSIYRFFALVSAASKAASTGEDAVVRLDQNSNAVLITGTNNQGKVLVPILESGVQDLITIDPGALHQIFPAPAYTVLMSEEWKGMIVQSGISGVNNTPSGSEKIVVTPAIETGRSTGIRLQVDGVVLVDNLQLGPMQVVTEIPPVDDPSLQFQKIDVVHD